jgi:hypothetical protein
MTIQKGIIISCNVHHKKKGGYRLELHQNMFIAKLEELAFIMADVVFEHVWYSGYMYDLS